MGILNLFKGKKQKNDETNVASQKDVRKEMSLAECVELMFRNAGIRPHVDGNKYLTEVQARHCVFTPVLVVEGNRLIIMVRFPAPVPEQFAYSVNYEVERINGMYRDAEVTLSHNDDGDFTIYSMIIKEYDSVSAETADEIRRLMVHAVDVLDEDNFRFASAGSATGDADQRLMSITNFPAKWGSESHWETGQVETEPLRRRSRDIRSQISSLMSPPLR